ncbi:MAG: adenosylcobinamide-GDP ribazoletransferase [Pseudomonadota bacterium]
MRKNDTVLWDPAVALVLLTRLPLPRLPNAAFASQARAAWAFPLVGVVVGLVAAAAGSAALALGLPPAITAGLVLSVQIIVTGAMHEDGLADTVDGLWGGWTAERRLEIMKDSRIGTYGVLALILSVGLRWSALTAILTTSVPFAAIIATGALSRSALPALMTTLPRARPGGLSDQVGAPGIWVSALALALGAATSVLALGGLAINSIMIMVAVVAGLARLAQVRIGGQTGDILGAAQQIAEISILLTCASML